MTFDENELRFIIITLECAADTYLKGAKLAGLNGMDRMVDAYREQAIRAKKLAERIQAEIC